MKKKSGVIFASLAATGAVFIAVACLTMNPSNSFASDQGIWNHYEGKANSFNADGCKEYWVNCSSHETVFAKPTGSIVEKGVVTDEIIATFEDDDPRLLKKAARLIDFESTDDLDLVSTVQNVAGLEISTAEKTSGNSSLKVTSGAGDFGFTIVKDWLDLAFADSDIHAIKFDIKGETTTSNFRHGSASGNTCYDMDNNNYPDRGIYTEWKTFSFDRSFYAANQNMFWGYIGNGKTFYVDNIRICNESDYDMKTIDFDCGGLMDSASGSTHDRRYSFTASQATGCATRYYTMLFNDNSAITNVCFDYNIHTSGSRSLHITKSASDWMYLRLAEKYVENMDTGVLLDIYSTVDVDQSQVKCDGNNTLFSGELATANGSWARGLMANRWRTLYIPKSAVGSDGRFLTIANTTAGDFYIDNIRPIKNGEDFEDAYFNNPNEYVQIGPNYYGPTAGEHTTTNNYYHGLDAWRDTRSASFWLNGDRATGGEFTSEYASKGSKSLKYTHYKDGDVINGSAGTSAYLSIDVHQAFVIACTTSISFDIMTFDGYANLRGTVVNPDGQWVTYTVNKEDITNGCRLFVSAEGSAFKCGHYYFDNLRIN